MSNVPLGADQVYVRPPEFGPVAVPDTAFAHKVEASLANAPIPREPTRPLLEPDDTANTRFWLVYVFNPPAELFGNDICQRGTSGAKSKGFAPAKSGTVEAVAAFIGRQESSRVDIQG